MPLNLSRTLGSHHHIKIQAIMDLSKTLVILHRINSNSNHLSEAMSHSLSITSLDITSHNSSSLHLHHQINTINQVKMIQGNSCLNHHQLTNHNSSNSEYRLSQVLIINNNQVLINHRSSNLVGHQPTALTVNQIHNVLVEEDHHNLALTISKINHVTIQEDHHSPTLIINSKQVLMSNRISSLVDLLLAVQTACQIHSFSVEEDLLSLALIISNNQLNLIQQG
jgi:hypothetical protein